MKVDHYQPKSHDDFNSLDNRVGLLLLTVLHVPGQPINVPSGIRGIMRTDLRKRESE